MTDVLISRENAREQLAARQPVTFRHFKGQLYTAYGLARDTETGNEYVVYASKDSASGVMYVRAADMFMERLDPAQYPDADQDYRFEVVE